MSRLYHEAIPSLFAGAYESLVSVVQGLALGALFYVVTAAMQTPHQLNIILVIKCVIVFLLICFLWHRYILHIRHQTWWITPVDTLIPMSFALIEAALCLSILKSTFFFCLWLVLFWMGGLLAYGNLYYQHRKDDKRTLYEEFYEKIHEEKLSVGLARFFGKTLWNEIGKYTRRCLWEGMILGLAFGGILLFICSTNYGEGLYMAIVASFFLPSIAYLFYFDFPRQLRNSQAIKDSLEGTVHAL